MSGSAERARAMATSGSLVNRTRRSTSIPKRLLREGKVHLLPLYALMRTSDLAREGIENSGSYRFADHVYRGRPAGRTVIGTILDGLLLRLRGARSMRSRFHHARTEIVNAARRQPAGGPFRVLSVPCGIARELVEAAAILRGEDPALFERASFFGMDLDPQALELSRQLAGEAVTLRLLRADAFDPEAYPTSLDVVVSTGFGDFLPDAELVRFLTLCRAALRADGTLVTSGMRRDPLTDFLIRELAELEIHYREPGTLVLRLEQAGFHHISARPDDVGLQTLLVARRGRGESSTDREQQHDL